ncbi:MAG: POTRA domain-containing protein [Bryobacteraceae bacterium]
MRAPVVLLSVVFWTTAIRPAHANPEQYEGRRIAVIAFDPVAQPLEASELHEMLPLKEKAVFHMADARGAIERLFATGRYADIQVAVEPKGPDVAVRIITKNSWFVGDVEVEGNISEPPNNGQIVNASRLDLGQPFLMEDVKTAEGEIAKLLVANGFYEHTIKPEFKYDDHAQQVHITFAIKTGKRAKFWTPRLTGQLELPPEKIVKATRWKRSILGSYRPVTQRRVRQGVDRVRAKYENSDRLLATVQLKDIQYDAQANRASPHLDIDAGPAVAIKTIGAKIGKKMLQANVPVYEERTVDRDLLAEGARNLRDELQSKGYFEADVEFKQQAVRNGKEEIDYLINPGPKHRFVYLEIQGNRYFKTGAIRERMFLEPKSLQFRHGRYSEAFVLRDQEAIANLYRSNGFHDAAVTATPVDNYKGRPGDVAVFIKIVEGQQWFVSRLDITGDRQLKLESILSTLSSSEDQPYSEFNVAADRDTILAYYFQNGFRNATFEWSSRPGAKPNLVALRYAIAEGRQQFVREVIPMGLETTQPKLVYRSFSLNPGDPLSPIRMADTQRRLYDLGIFAKVDMAVQDPDGDTSHKFVLYDIEEARRYSITGGAGAEIAQIGGLQAQNSLDNPGGAPGFSPRVSLDASRINFLGLGRTLSFRGRFSNFQKRGLINYLAPRVWNNPNFDLSFTTIYDDSHDIRTFASKREEGSVQLSQKLSKPTTLFYRFTYRNVSASQLKLDPLLIPLLAQSVRVGLLSGNLIQDRRDDPTDAHKGIYNTLDLSLASKVFGSQTSFFRVLARDATYHRIGKKLVLAREVTLGLAPAFGKSRTGDPTDPIPLPERFFGGGGSSSRAFPDNQAGPRDAKTGFPLGGSAEFFNNTELRFPLIGENVGGVLFHDMGNVYSSIGKLSFRVNQKDNEDFNYMVHAVGFGIRYRTPIGPVRVDLAYSINPPRFTGFKGTYPQLVQCSLNNSCVTASQRISHVQYFFSIGQTF